MVPNVLRTLPSSGVTFMVYESTRSFLSRGREED
jgi:solute carrier family 25 folate transporter 32